MMHKEASKTHVGKGASTLSKKHCVGSGDEMLDEVLLESC